MHHINKNNNKLYININNNNLFFKVGAGKSIILLYRECEFSEGTQFFELCIFTSSQFTPFEFDYSLWKLLYIRTRSGLTRHHTRVVNMVQKCGYTLYII